MKSIFEFQLVGRVGEEAIDSTLTVKSTKNLFCSGCGERVKWADNYCKDCGKRTENHVI